MNTDANLEALFNRLADGLGSEEDEGHLSQLLRSSPDARRAYRQFMALHSALHWDYVALATPELPRVTGADSESLPPSTANQIGRFIAFGAGVLLTSLVALGIYLLRPVSTPSERIVISTGTDTPAKAHAVAALLVDGVGVEFSNGRSPDGVRFVPGEYELTQGIVHLRFAYGADMVLAAPARIEVIDAQRTRLIQGNVRVVVPPTAKGFTVATRDVDFVDLGTEFGLRVDPASGASDLYVFDGQVNVTDPHSGTVLPVTGGNSTRQIDGRPAAAPPVKEADFPTPGTIGLKRWEMHERRLRKDPTLLAFFPFRKQTDEAVLTNAVAGGMEDGRITGARWTMGRWPGKDALLFGRDTDFAQVTIPGEHQELTIAAWVKVERIDNVLNAILNSDGSDQGAIHFQLNRQGFVRGGVIVDGPFQDSFVGKPVPLGQWTHVASVISARSRSQQIYVNGVLARERHWKNDAPLRPGSCRIGNWLADPNDSFPHRALRGQIDEFAVWGRALKIEEIRRLVDSGRPGLLWTQE